MRALLLHLWLAGALLVPAGALAQAASAAAPATAQPALPDDSLPSLANVATQLADTATALQAARAQQAQFQATLERIERSMRSIERRSRVHALGREFAQTVIDQLRALPRPTQFEADRDRRAQAQEEASDASLRTDRALGALGDIDTLVAQRLAAARPPVPAEQRDAFVDDAQTQLTQLRDMLVGLDELQRELLVTLQAAQQAEGRLMARSASAREELTQLLFWVPARPSLKAASELWPSIAWMAAPAHWSAALAALGDEALRRPLPTALALALVVGLWAGRARLLALLVSLSPAAQGFRRYRIGHTVQGIAVSFALALPLPLLMAIAATLLAGASGVPAFTPALGEALINVGTLLLVITFFAWLLDPRGVAVRHFGWHETTLGATAQSLRRFTIAFLPLIFIAALNGLDNAPFSNRESLGRLSFSLSMLVLALFMLRLLRRRGMLMRRLAETAPRHWALQWHWLWFTLLLAVPTGVAVLAAAGYFVAAGFFFGRMSYTLFCVLTAVVLYGLMALWVNVQRAHLDRRRADEARQALAADDAAPYSAEIAPLPAARIDVATIGEQTRSLLDMLILLLLLVSLWAVWKGAVPALSVISDFRLWSYSANVGDKEVLHPLTVGDLFIVVLIGAVTAVVVRNIGALLDIVLLQRLQVQADATYAIKIVSRYVVAGVGLVLACALLGVGWNDVHWLVAALGVGLGFGLQEIFANFISGLIVLAERPIRIGDVVTVGDVSGTVSRIRARATAVVDFDNKEVIIPNKAFITERVVNWTLSNQTTRLLFEVGVAYGSDVVRVQQLLLDAVQRHDDVLAEPSANVSFVGFGDSALNFQVRVFVGAFDKRLRVRHDINVAIERALRENGIVIPFPQRDVHVHPVPGATAG